MEKVSQTKSEHFISLINGYGAIVFSPYTGLTYAVEKKYMYDTYKWLNGDGSINLPNEITQPLLIGWKTDYSKAMYTQEHLLPNKNSWEDLTQPYHIIAINWLLTGFCNLNCKYCYANDLMNIETMEPHNEKQVINIANRILSYNPLFVVLTGGEPLLSNYLKTAINCLYGKTGIIIDTNGILLTEELISYLKLKNITIRISLDSPRPKNNFKIRPNKTNKNNYFNELLDNILLCQKSGLNIIIQTVATKINKNELTNLGDIIYKLGINGWRILPVQLSNNKNKEIFGKEVLTYKYDHNFHLKFKEIKNYHSSRWDSSFSLQIVEQNAAEKNSVILVSSDGKFWTQSHIKPFKVLLDSNHENKPTITSIFKKVNVFSHYARYINIKN